MTEHFNKDKKYVNKTNKINSKFSIDLAGQI